MFVANRADGFDARVRKHIYGFREGLQISKKKSPYWICYKTVPHDCWSRGRNAYICHKSWFPVHYCCDKDFAICFSYIHVFIICDITYTIMCMFFQLLIINKMLELYSDVSSVFLFLCVIFLNFCLFFVLYFLHVGSMFMYISLYILWKPVIKTIIIIIIILEMFCSFNTCL